MQDEIVFVKYAQNTEKMPISGEKRRELFSHLSHSFSLLSPQRVYKFYKNI